VAGPGDGVVKGGLAFVVGGVELGASSEEELDGGEVADGGGVVEGGDAVVVGGVGVCAGFEEVGNFCTAPDVYEGVVQRGVAFVAFDVGVQAGFEEELERFGVAVLGGAVEEGVVGFFAQGGAGVGFGAEEFFDDARVGVFYGGLEHALVVDDGVGEAGVFLEEIVDRLEVGGADRLHEGVGAGLDRADVVLNRGVAEQCGDGEKRGEGDAAVYDTALAPADCVLLVEGCAAFGAELGVGGCAGEVVVAAGAAGVVVGGFAAEGAEEQVDAQREEGEEGVAEEGEHGSE
jgi:hypothetical protein